MARLRRSLASALLAGALTVSAAACRTPAAESPPAAPRLAAQSPAPAPRGRTAQLVLTTRVWGTPEPCGCTSEPLGDVARLASLLGSDPGSRALLLDAGGLRYGSEPLSEEKRREARQRADFLEQTYASLGAVVMVQPEDLRGPDGAGELWGHQRLATNLAGLPAGTVLPEVIRSAGGIKVGVLGLCSADGAWPAGVTVQDPVAAARAGVERLRAAGAEVTVALTGLPRDRARALARRVPGLDLVVVGGDGGLEQGVDEAEPQAGALLVVPGIKVEHAVRVELRLPDAPTVAGAAPAPAPARGPLQLVRSPAQAERLRTSLTHKLTAAEARLKSLRADPGAEAAFVRATEADVQRLRDARAAAEAAPAGSPAPDAATATVTAELVPIGRSLPREPGVAQAMSELDRRTGEANLRALSGPPPTLPPPPIGGQPAYLGAGGCLGACHYHDDAVEFWQKTRHAGAWQTLVDAKKDLSLSCIGCHAVGVDEPGGSNLFTLTMWQRDWQRSPHSAVVGKTPVADLRNVNCEVCHGPGSLHVKAPSRVKVPIPAPTVERCLTCHTKEHSDTFEHAAYLRDILGPGHGEERRKALGDGPTGHALRSAALARAKQTGTAAH